MTTVQKITDIASLPEAGRIRTGVKAGKAMKAIDTFRFTSVDRGAIEALADIYGGTPKPWHDPKANPSNQFEVITNADEINVVVSPTSFDLGYELWAASGRVRRCDGETCDAVTWQNRNQYSETVPCICNQQQLLECKPKTRLSVIIPNISFAGTWRYESSGMTTAATLPTMMQLIGQLQASGQGLVPVKMALVDQEINKGGARKFKIVQLRLGVSIDQILTGQGTYAAQLNQADVPPPTIEAFTDDRVLPDPDTQIVDAELLDDDDEPEPAETMTKEQAKAYVAEHGGSMFKEGAGWNVRS